MVEKIYDIKNKALQRMEQAIAERGVDRMDVKEMGELADIVKDLSEAEKACWEAEYYRSVTDAMESSGYMPDGMGYDGQDGSGGVRRTGGRSGYRDSLGRYASRGGRRGYDGGYGYQHDPMQAVRDAMSTATAEDREKMMRELRTMVGM